MTKEKANISELRFIRCIHWNTGACPHHKEAVMGLSVINRSNLYVLSDATVAVLNTLCEGCRAFGRKPKTSPGRS
jgi:hypothetical protein